MDIDEFLDREAVDIDSAGKSSQLDAPQEDEISDAKQDSFGEIKGHFASGDLEKAEQSYFQMWSELMQHKLKWDKGLYDNLLSSSRQFSMALSKAYAETRRKSDNIHALIGKARTALKEGKKEESFKIYSEISKIDSSIPNVFFEEKKVIWEHMMELYKDLKSVTDMELVKRVSKLIADINLSLDRISVAMSSKDTKEAASYYSKCIDLYSQIPEGFLMHKNSIGIRILDAYRTLSIQSEISSLQLQLNVPSMQRPQYSETRQPHAVMPTPLMERELFAKQMNNPEPKKDEMPILTQAKPQPFNQPRKKEMEDTFQKLKSYSRK